MRFAAAALLLTASLAHGQGGMAVVAVDGCQQGTSAHHAHAVRGALIQQAPDRVVPQDEVIQRLGGVPRGTLADAERLLASARFDFFDQSALERAERTLLTAIDDLRALPHSDGRWQDLKDAHALLAFLYTRQNDRARAEATITRVLAVEPKLQVSEDLFPPSFRSWIDEHRKKLARQSDATLKVVTHPAGRPVIVEGRAMGSSPLTLKLPPGKYRVEADFETGTSIPRVVALDEAASIELWRDFEGQIHVARGPCLGTDGTRNVRLSSLSRLAGLIGAETVVGVREEELAPNERFVVATMIDARTGQEAREGRIKVPPHGVPDASSYARLAEFLSTGEVVPPVLVGAETKLTQTAPVPSSTEVAKASGGSASALRTTSYVAGGVGLAAVAGGAVLLLQSGSTLEELDQHRDPNVPGAFLPNRSEQISEIQQRADGQKTAGYLIGGVGAAAIIGSIIVFVVANEATEGEETAWIVPTGNGVQVRF